MDGWDRLAIGVRTLARLHDALGGRVISDAPFGNSISADAALAATRRGVARIRTWQPTEAEQRTAESADRLARFLADAERDWKRLPTVVGHGDFWDDNVLFRAGEFVLVADFEFMARRPRVDDLALTLYLAALDFAADPATDDDLHRLAELVAAYDAAAASPLSPTERAAPPPATARQPLWSIGGWVVRLDDERAARRHTEAAAREVEWALAVTRDLDRWRAAFA